jgi:hypothetical protein
MNPGKLTKATIIAYRTGVLAGIGVLIWLGQNFATKAELAEFKREQRERWSLYERERTETIEVLRSDMAIMRRSIERVETLLLNRRRADVGRLE